MNTLDFVLQFAIFLSLGAVIFLFAQALPRLDEPDSEKKTLGRFFANLPIHKFDTALAAFLEKNLRRARVVLLRIDNGVMSYLGRIKNHSLNGIAGNRKNIFSATNAEETASEGDKKEPPQN